MESTYLRTLLEVVESGSLIKAAANLFVTQSAVSRRLKYLEDHYGLPLFDRSGPSLKLTDAGTLVCEKAGLLLALEDDLDSEFKNKDWTRPLSFCCTPAFGVSYMPEIMSRFMKKDTPETGLEVHFDIPERILSGMRTQRFDVAVLESTACEDLQGLTFVDLPGDEIVFISSPQLGLPTPEAPLETVLDQALFSRKEGCCSRLNLEANLAAVGHTTAEFRSIAVIDDLNLIAQAVSDGRGITYVPTSVLAAPIAAGTLVTHRVKGFTHSRSRALLVGETDIDDLIIDEFAACVQAAVPGSD